MQKECLTCKQIFVTKYVFQLFCSQECKKEANPWRKLCPTKVVSKTAPTEELYFPPLHLPSVEADIGVYCIYNLITNKFYIGSSVRILSRKNHHFMYLRRNKHTNVNLQQSYNTFGAGAFVLIVLEKAEPEEIIQKEEKWLNQFSGTGRLYNVYGKFFVGGEEHPFNNRTHTEEVKQLLREIRRNQIIVHSEETKRRIGLASSRHRASEESKKLMSIIKRNEYEKKSDEEKKAMVDRLNQNRVIRVLTEDEQDRVVDLYVGGLPVYTISEDLRISGDVIKRCLIERGISLRTTKEQYKLTMEKKCKK